MPVELGVIQAEPTVIPVADSMAAVAVGSTAAVAEASTVEAVVVSMAAVVDTAVDTGNRRSKRTEPALRSGLSV
jgi:hypothetical protein